MHGANIIILELLGILGEPLKLLLISGLSGLGSSPLLGH